MKAGNCDVLKQISIGLILAAVVGVTSCNAGALRGGLSQFPMVFHVPAISDQIMAQDAGQFPVKPSEAALIAQGAYPGAKVLGVKLLPSGEYAVTLKVGGSVQKVMVNATSGAIG